MLTPITTDRLRLLRSDIDARTRNAIALIEDLTQGIDAPHLSLGARDGIIVSSLHTLRQQRDDIELRYADLAVLALQWLLGQRVIERSPAWFKAKVSASANKFTFYTSASANTPKVRL